MFNFFKDNRGATAVEYGIIAAGIGLAILTGVSVVGKNTEATFCTVASVVGTNPATCSEVVYDGNGIPEGVNPNFITNTGGSNQFHSEFGLLLNDAINNINTNDPIVGIYGLYDESGNPVKTYSAFSSYTNGKTDGQDLNGAGGNESWTLGGAYGTQDDSGTDDYQTMFQVVGSSGTVYNVSGDYLPQGIESDPNNDGFSIQVSNAKTGTVNNTLQHAGGTSGATIDSGFTK